MNLPNSLTVTRICLVPLLVVVLLTKFEGRQILGVPTEFVGAAIFGLASLTDWADGYLARRRKQITPFGQFIDPLADKLLTLAAYTGGTEIVAYVEPVGIGDSLPDMPVFLTADRYIPCPLEATYQTAWEQFPAPLKGPLEPPLS